MKSRSEQYDVVVVGGGLAGFCAAVASARGGAKTCLVQDRPVFGGNSSSEVRVTPHGTAAFHAYARETGIISELLIEERARNHEVIFENGWTNSVWDLVMYDLAMNTPNLTFHVNTSVQAVKLGDGPAVTQTELPNDKQGFLHRPACNKSRTLSAVIGRVSGAELEIELRAKQFIDCTGDGVVADLAGCEWRMGSESYDEFREPHAPKLASRDTMGNSIHFKTRDTGKPAPFVAPEWAVKHTDASYFYDQGRHPKDIRGGFWWIEIGVPWDTIYQAEDIRHELTRHALGVWDWMKNKDPKTKDAAANYALDWIGQVPGKRESRRIIGQYFMTEHDVQSRTVFADEVAFGGWFLDLHTPGGLLAPTSEPCSAEGYSQKSEYAVKSYVGPYSIPLRSLISKDIDNLMMAGRNVSMTHAALGTARVMGTTALMGQAVGTAAALSVSSKVIPAKFSPEQIHQIQQQLLRDGCFLRGQSNDDAKDFAREAKITASSEATFSEVRPDSTSVNTGLGWWKDQVQLTHEDRLISRRGQWIAVGESSANASGAPVAATPASPPRPDAKGDAGVAATEKGNKSSVATGRIDTLSVCLTNSSGQPQKLDAWIVAVDHIWDYRIEPSAPLASTTLAVPPGEKIWIDWPVNLDLSKPRITSKYIRLDLGENPALQWHSSEALIPGHLSAYQIGPGKMRRYGNGATMSVRVSPPQKSFGPQSVVTGVTRPYASPNLWRSDPAQPLPQWLELAWNSPRKISSIELTFPGHLLREYHAYSPHYRDPQCPMDYQIEALHNGAHHDGAHHVGAQQSGNWSPIVQVEGNYHRRRVHALPTPITTTAIRLKIVKTNGDPSAGVYEVRVY